MNSFNIKKTLHSIVGEWKETMPFLEKARDSINDVIITGGAIVSLLEGNPPNDYDVYFKTEEACKHVSDYYNKLDKEHKESVKAYESAKKAGLSPSEPEKPGVHVVWKSSNAISLSNKIQVITRFTGSADEIHKNFDFLHCMCVYDYKENTLRLPPEALECIINHELRWENSKYPLCSLLRMNKFIKRGWRINAGQVVKMCLAIHELNLKDPKVLKDQLLGVDSAYFSQLLRAIEKEDNVTVQMISDIIDEVFHGKPDSTMFMEPEELMEDEDIW